MPFGDENPNYPHKSNPPHPAIAVHHQAPSKGATIVHWATWALNTLRGKLNYSETAERSQMFHCHPGVVSTGTHADCSQFYATCAHWAGVTTVDDKDFTGTLLKKGHLVAVPEPGDCVIFGGGDGEHAGVMAERDSNDWWVIGFGHQGAPDRVLLSQLETYFRNAGHPGVRFLRFA